MFYYYAFIENGLCTDIERTKREKTDLTDYIQVSQEEYDAYMNDETASDKYIIGKRWTGSEWVLPEKFYYAVINDKKIVVDQVISDAELTESNLIPITQEEYESRIYIHQKWDEAQDKFVEVPFSEYADTDTTMVSVKGSNTALQTLLEQIQLAIGDIDCNMSASDILAAILGVDGSGSGLDADTLDGFDSTTFAKVAALNELSNVVAGKAAANHSHSNYAAVGHTHSDYATNTALANGLAGKANASHVHSEYAPALHDHSLASHIQVRYTEGNMDSNSNSSGIVSFDFSPDIVIIVPDNGYEFTTIDNTSSYGKVSYFYGGVFVKNVNASSFRGCEINGNNVTLYTNVSGSYSKLLFNTYGKIVIGIKF